MTDLSKEYSEKMHELTFNCMHNFLTKCQLIIDEPTLETEKKLEALIVVLRSVVYTTYFYFEENVEDYSFEKFICEIAEGFHEETSKDLSVITRNLMQVIKKIKDRNA